MKTAVSMTLFRSFTTLAALALALPSVYADGDKPTQQQSPPAPQERQPETPKTAEEAAIKGAAEIGGAVVDGMTQALGTALSESVKALGEGIGQALGEGLSAVFEQMILTKNHLSPEYEAKLKAMKDAYEKQDLAAFQSAATADAVHALSPADLKSIVFPNLFWKEGLAHLLDQADLQDSTPAYRPTQNLVVVSMDGTLPMFIRLGFREFNDKNANKHVMRLAYGYVGELTANEQFEGRAALFISVDQGPMLEVSSDIAPELLALMKASSESKGPDGPAFNLADPRPYEALDRVIAAGEFEVRRASYDEGTNPSFALQTLYADALVFEQMAVAQAEQELTQADPAEREAKQKELALGMDAFHQAIQDFETTLAARRVLKPTGLPGPQAMVKVRISDEGLPLRVQETAGSGGNH